MIRFLLRRVLQSIPLLLLISALVFWLIHAAPGGPLAIYLVNPNVRPEDIERLRRALGLDRSIWQQYWSWLAAFAHGDWGYSFSDGRPVSMRIIERIPATLELVATSILVALALTLPVGVVAAVRRGRWFDRTTTAVAAAGISLPAFWFGLLLQMVFAIGLGWVPSSGRTTIGGGARGRSPAASAPAGDGACRRAGRRLVPLPARIDDRGPHAAVRPRRRRRAASRPAR